MARTFAQLWIGVALLCFLSSGVNGEYQIGVGIADCTAPSAGIVFMGYAKSSQKGCGIHLRQWSRAFIFDDGKTRVAYVTVDTCMVPHSIKREVIRQLKTQFNDTYDYKNVIMSGTHSHGTPGGFMMDLMYDIPDFGFVGETLKALTTGITRSIVKAHNNMVEGKIFVNTGEVLNANINRSPASYLFNPEEERQEYKYNVDKELVQLKFIRSNDSKIIGAINWFAVHPTSMNNTNCLVTSDNVGYASLLLENYLNGDVLPGTGSFVGAFASTNLGDVSPNIKGPHCLNTGEPCDNVTSTCDGQARFCVAFGPGNDMVESTKIIAERIYSKAVELLPEGEEVTGPIGYIHKFVNMPEQIVQIDLGNGTLQEVHGCIPAMGYSFAAGTTDGPGEFDFTQATVTENPFWNAVRDFAFPPTEEQIECQKPKPILINSGGAKFPYQWIPSIVATQIIRLGSIIMTAVPGEFTTMSGRRLRKAVKAAILNNGGPNNTRVIITGLSNVYTSYIATPEEYQLQRYEGASTIFGPYTLPIYLQVYTELAEALMKDEDTEDGPMPPDFSSKLITLLPPVFFDTAGVGNKFGDCIQQPPSVVNINDTVSAVFISGHPRNDPMLEKTFLTVEKLNEDESWTVVATDASWETRFIWTRTKIFTGQSTATVEWDIGPKVTPGTYRIRHFGKYKYILGGILLPYEGASNTFTVQ